MGRSRRGAPRFPGNPSRCTGSSAAAIKPLCEKLEGYDLVVVIAAPVFRYYPYVPGDYLPSGTRLVHITDNPSEASRAPVGDSILADPGTACGVLADLVSKATRPRPAPLARRPGAQGKSGHHADFLFHTVNELRPAELGARPRIDVAACGR